MPEGEIIIVSCAFSMGKSGNIKAGQNIEFPYISDSLKGYSIYDAIGGANPETLEEGLIRVRDLLSNDERAVSENDYEEIIKKTPGLRIWDCKVLENSAFNDDKYENEVRIVVRPYSENRYAVLSKAYEKNILNEKKVSAYVICVGNLTTGGVGKTPIVANLANEISKNKVRF